MKWALIILIFFPAALQAQEYKVRSRCMGNGTYAMVVEHNKQFYIVETPEYFQNNWIIEDLLGISLGGNRILYYMNSVGVTDNIEVRVLSRLQWKYAGYSGAKAICRQITQTRFGPISNFPP
ncbi:hypothetical protein [Fodinibius sediminis]|uniref:Uncharacterized protein n=1 Tax=Fodinibius sediminis TaxID=1214077 RepID=A0A521CGK6_9BACT|nr:hypothetical protein [Fodinibius sediminis]SMO58568.1 hypothetical protein SAMN06265218_10666 [Fodinibius sediminis]